MVIVHKRFIVKSVCYNGVVNSGSPY